jgi:hypothetical protein
MSLRVQVRVARVQLQPLPLNAVAVNPAGSVSTTVTVPLVGRVPIFDTTIVYCAPVCPWVKLPLWLLVRVRSGWARAVFVKVQVSGPSASESKQRRRWSARFAECMPRV